MPDELLAVADAPVFGSRGRTLGKRARRDYRQKLARFDRYQAAHPELTLTVAVRTFLASIPPAGRRNVVAALRARGPGLAHTPTRWRGRER